MTHSFQEATEEFQELLWWWSMTRHLQLAEEDTALDPLEVIKVQRPSLIRRVLNLDHELEVYTLGI